MRKKVLFIALAILTCMPMNSQFLLRHRNKTQKTSVSYVSPLSMANRSATVQHIQPKKSILVESVSSLTLPDTLTYDRHGNLTEYIEDQTSKEVWEYDASGQMLMNSYWAIRENVNAPWEAPTYGFRRHTTLDENGVRTSVQDEDYDEIRLNNQGLVTYFIANDGNEFLDEGTQTWEGNRLKALSFQEKDILKNEESIIELNDIDIIFSHEPFNPYKISYFPYLAGVDLDFLDTYDKKLVPNLILFNATGKMKNTSHGVTLENDIRFLSQVIESPVDKPYPYYKMKITLTLNGTTQNIMEYTYNQIDENGSFVINITDYTDYIESIYTFEYDNHGNIAKSELVELDIDAIGSKRDDIEGGAFSRRYDWEYDTEGKPLKITIYDSVNGGKDETLSSTEVFTAWYDASAINDVVTDTAKILDATLYTINGTPVRNLTVEEIQANKIEVQQKGIYLLVIKTNKGIETRKIIR